MSGADRDAALGLIQRHVLMVLANRGASPCTDWAAWYPLQTQQVRGAIMRLAWRGLVDVSGWKGRSRTFDLTRAGRSVVDGLTEEGS